MATENWVDLFHSPSLNQSLRDDGIVKVTIPNLDVDRLTSFLERTVDGYPENFETTFFQSVCISDKDVKQKLDEGIRDILSESINSLFVNHRLLTYFFLVKGVGENSLLKLHQDWSIVDEREYHAYNLWIPLCDSTKENGTLHAAKGTHRIPLNIRGGGIPPKFNEHFSSAEKYMEAFEVNVGEALIFDSRILHYSPANTSKLSRTTIVNNIVPTDAQTMCFHGSNQNGKFTVNSYDVPDDLFIHYDNFNAQKDDPNPKGVFIKEIDSPNIESIDKNSFIQLMKTVSTKKRRWFF